MNILAIESSCDETAAAVVKDGVHVLGNAVATSKDMHEKYGGIVPEVAARAQLESVIPVIMEATGIKDESSVIDHLIDTIDAIAVTQGPGLIGSLLVGVETAKTMALVTDKPLIPVNHVLAHMYANFVDNSSRIQYPAISLVVSGGHTELYLMELPKKLKWLGGTLDDAAGECFDKTARLLGFGHGGGLAIQEAAADYHGQKPTVPLPHPILLGKNEFNFSFSGLKTAIWREWNKETDHSSPSVGAFAHAVQEIITGLLVEKTLKAAGRIGVKSILLSGGVASNLRLREKFREELDFKRLTIPLFVPPVNLCTDNAAYIASYAYFRGKKAPWRKVTAVPDLSVESI